MDCIELLEILDKGEDTTHQFKANFTSIDALAVEISAFANTGWGHDSDRRIRHRRACRVKQGGSQPS